MAKRKPTPIASERRVELIKLECVRIDGDTQPREQIDLDAVNEYAEAIEAGKELPPVECVFDGTNYWLWDGFHRLHAHRKAGSAMLHVAVTDGTKDDAQWICLSANHTHGLRRTNADKRRAVELALARKPNLNNVAIAGHCGVSDRFVGNMRAELSPNRSMIPAERIVTRGGTTYTQNTANIGKKAKPPADQIPAKSDPVVILPSGDVLESEPEAEPEQPVSQPAPAPAKVEIEEAPPEKSVPPVRKPPTEDGWGVPIQPHAVEAFLAVPQFKDLIWHVKKARQIFSTLAKREGGQFLQRPEVSAFRRSGEGEDGQPIGKFVSHALEDALKQIENAQPTFTACPWNHVDAPHPNPCPTCLGLNWTPVLGTNIPPMAIDRIKEKYGV